MPGNHKERIEKLVIFTFLKYLIRDNFPGFMVSYDDNKIYVKGKLSDQDWKNSYEFLICSTLISQPVTYILSPVIIPNLGIHMYQNHSLCLYHPDDIPKNYNFCFVSDIIPWLIKWVHYYEIWLRNGNIWLGSEAPH